MKMSASAELAPTETHPQPQYLATPKEILPPSGGYLDIFKNKTLRSSM